MSDDYPTQYPTTDEESERTPPADEEGTATRSRPSSDTDSDRETESETIPENSVETKPEDSETITGRGKAPRLRSGSRSDEDPAFRESDRVDTEAGSDTEAETGSEAGGESSRQSGRRELGAPVGSESSTQNQRFDPVEESPSAASTPAPESGAGSGALEEFSDATLTWRRVALVSLFVLPAVAIVFAQIAAGRHHMDQFGVNLVYVLLAAGLAILGGSSALRLITAIRSSGSTQRERETDRHQK